MAKKSKARGAPNKMGAADKQKAQSARFIEAARNTGVDKSGKEFERALEKLVPSNKKTSGSTMNAEYKAPPVWMQGYITRIGGVLSGQIGALTMVLGREREFNGQGETFQIREAALGPHAERVGGEIYRKEE